jgi:hypothetical protein
MKRVWLLLILLLLVGCSNGEMKQEKTAYNEYIDELKHASNKNFSNYLPFNINLYYDKIIETEVMFRVIIDKPKEPIRNIEAIVIHNQKTDDIFPTSGVFDQEYSLIPNVINKKSNYVEGIILVGYIPFDLELNKFNAEFKVLVKYEDDDLKTHKVYYLSKIDNLVDSSD